MSAEVRHLVDPITSARHLARVLDEMMEGDPDVITRLRASLAEANRILATLLADDPRQRDGERADREPIIVTIVIVRHPDSENAVEYHAPEGIEVRFVTADLGSSFDGHPTDQDEAQCAIEIAEALEEGVKNVPDGPAKALATSWADTLRDDAREYLPDDPEDEDEEYDDGKTLVAGVLYDNETGEEADPQ